MLEGFQRLAVGSAPCRALQSDVTGPMLRAAGLKWDIRKTEPYSSYDKFDFEVPTRTENDVYARYLVRIEEMRQSARIIKQALEGMPDGRWTANAPHVVTVPGGIPVYSADGKSRIGACRSTGLRNSIFCRPCGLPL